MSDLLRHPVETRSLGPALSISIPVWPAAPEDACWLHFREVVALRSWCVHKRTRGGSDGRGSFDEQWVELANRLTTVSTSAFTGTAATAG